jgi:hypothetical protein
LYSRPGSGEIGNGFVTIGKGVSVGNADGVQVRGVVGVWVGGVAVDEGVGVDTAIVACAVLVGWSAVGGGVTVSVGGISEGVGSVGLDSGVSVAGSTAEVWVTAAGLVRVSVGAFV